MKAPPTGTAIGVPGTRPYHGRRIADVARRPTTSRRYARQDRGHGIEGTLVIPAVAVLATAAAALGRVPRRPAWRFSGCTRSAAG